MSGAARRPLERAKRSVDRRREDENVEEAVGGFDLLECGSLEEAVEIAATHPLAEIGAIEVRPLWGN